MPRVAETQLPFHAAPSRADGRAFVDYLYDRCIHLTDTATQARTLSRRLWSFLQEYDHLRHEMQDEMRKPSVEEFAERWRMPSRTASHAFTEFFSVFPTEQDPHRVCEELWSGIGRQAGNGHLMALGSVTVVEQ